MDVFSTSIPDTFANCMVSKIRDFAPREKREKEMTQPSLIAFVFSLSPLCDVYFLSPREKREKEIIQTHSDHFTLLLFSFSSVRWGFSLLP